MSKIKLSRKTIKVKTSDHNGKPIDKPITAWVYKDRLAAHKCPVKGVWTITQVSTGYRVTYFRGKYNQIRGLLHELNLIGINWGIDNVDRVRELLYGERNQCHKIYALLNKYEMGDNNGL